MTASGTVRNQANVLISGPWSRAHIGKIFAAKAREVRDDYIQRGEAAPTYQTVVDGKIGAREEDTKIGGFVLYRFNQLLAAITFALSYVLTRSPVGSGRDRHPGRFRKSWVIAVNGRDYTGDIADIPFDAVVTIVNITPYSRRLSLGRHKFTLASNLPSDLRQVLVRRFPTLDSNVVFVDLPASLSRAGVKVPVSTRKGPMRYPAVQIQARA